MSIAPLPNQTITPNEIKNFESIEYKINNIKYLLKIFNDKNNLGFSIETLNSFPKKEYYYVSSLKNLQSINRFFLFFENTEEIKMSLVKMANEKNLTFLEEKDKCTIYITNTINDSKFCLNIPIKVKDLKLEMENIISVIVELQEKNENLEKRVKYLEEYIKILEKEKKINLNKISNILTNDDSSLIISWLPNNPSKFELLFDTKRDRDYASTFHDKCDGQYPTLIIIKSNTGYIFGGYVTSPWDSNNSFKSAPNSFIFSINQKQKYYAKTQNKEMNGRSRTNSSGSLMFSIGCCDILIYHCCTQNSSNKTNMDTYSSSSQNILNGGNQNFTVSNLEVYKVFY